jgi:hypothetical protein
LALLELFLLPFMALVDLKGKRFKFRGF